MIKIMTKMLKLIWQMADLFKQKTLENSSSVFLFYSKLSSATSPKKVRASFKL